MNRFCIGDWVYASDWCFGQIVRINKDNTADVEFETCGGTACFGFGDLVLANSDQEKSLRTPYNSSI